MVSYVKIVNKIEREVVGVVERGEERPLWVLGGLHWLL